MARHVLLHVDTSGGRQSGPVAEDFDWLRTAIAYRLRNGGVENPTATYAFGADRGTRRVSGAIFLSLTPRQVRSLLVDARISILLARQRGLDNEQYRLRLAAAAHYRALRPYLSMSFKEMMVRHSNWPGYRFAASRSSPLVTAYQNEIGRLEMELLKLSEGNVSVLYMAPTAGQPVEDVLKSLADHLSAS